MRHKTKSSEEYFEEYLKRKEKIRSYYKDLKENKKAYKIFGELFLSENNIIDYISNFKSFIDD